MGVWEIGDEPNPEDRTEDTRNVATGRVLATPVPGGTGAIRCSHRWVLKLPATGVSTRRTRTDRRRGRRWPTRYGPVRDGRVSSPTTPSGRGLEPAWCYQSGSGLPSSDRTVHMTYPVYKARGEKISPHTVTGTL